MFRFFKIVVSIFLLASQYLNAQGLLSYAHLYSIENGLTDRSSRIIFQDSRGLIWIPTPSGMNLFDGHEFRHFTKETHNLRSNNFEKAMEDPKGRIWFVSLSKLNQDGLAYYRVNIDVFDPITKHIDLLSEVVHLPFDIGHLVFIYNDHQRNIWFSTDKGELFKYDGYSIKLIFQKKVKKDWAGHYMISSDKNIVFKEKDKITFLDSLGNVQKEINLPYRCHFINADLHGKIWLSNIRTHQKDKGGVTIWELNGKGELTPLFFKDRNGTPLQVPAAEFKYIVPTLQGQFVGFIGERFMQFDRRGRMVHDFTNDLQSYGIESEHVHIGMFNREVIWLGTRQGALSLYSQMNPFQTYLLDTKGVKIGTIFNDQDGNVYFNFKNTQKLKHQNGKLTVLNFKNITANASDQQGFIWMGDEFGGLFQFDPHLGKIDTLIEPKITSESEYYNQYAIRCIHLLHDSHQLLIGSDSGGLTIYDLNNHESSSLKPLNDFTSPEKIIVHHILEKKERLWLATNQGIFSIDAQLQKIEHFSHQHGELPNTIVYHLHEDEDGIFWLATNEDGLIKWARKKKSYTIYNKPNGLYSSTVFAIYEDKYSRLWLPSRYGLMQFDKKNETVTTWLSQDGLPSDEFIYNAHFQDTSGHLYFGSAKGVAAFNPDGFTLAYNEDSKHLTISQYLQTNKNTGEKQDRTVYFNKTKKILFLPTVSSIEIKVALLDFRIPNSVSYRYKIEGFNKKWNFQRSNIIHINSIPYGNYTLKIQASGANKKWSSQSLSIPLVVEKPFYLKVWFLVVLTLLLIGLIVSYNYWRTRQLQKDKKQLEQEVANRTQTILEQKKELEILNNTKDRFFAIIAHDMRNAVYNFRGVTDKINYFIERKQPARINEFGNQINTAVGNLTNLMNNLLDWALQQKNAFPYEPINIDLNKKIKHVIKNLQEQADRKQIEIEITNDENVFAFADNNALSTILRNVIGNAIKFTPPEGKVSVMAEKKEKDVSIRIVDNGTGMSSEQLENLFQLNHQKTSRGTAGEKGSGLGLVLAKELLEINQGRIKVESEEGEGTVIQLILPAAETPSFIVSN